MTHNIKTPIYAYVLLSVPGQHDMVQPDVETDVKPVPNPTAEQTMPNYISVAQVLHFIHCYTHP